MWSIVCDVLRYLVDVWLIVCVLCFFKDFGVNLGAFSWTASGKRLGGCAKRLNKDLLVTSSSCMAPPPRCNADEKLNDSSSLLFFSKKVRDSGKFVNRSYQYASVVGNVEECNRAQWKLLRQTA